MSSFLCDDGLDRLSLATVKRPPDVGKPVNQHTEDFSDVSSPARVVLHLRLRFTETAVSSRHARRQTFCDRKSHARAGNVSMRRSIFSPGISVDVCVSPEVGRLF